MAFRFGMIKKLQVNNVSNGSSTLQHTLFPFKIPIEEKSHTQESGKITKHGVCSSYVNIMKQGLLL